VPSDEHGIARIVVDRLDDRVNAIDAAMIQGLLAAVAAARTAGPSGLVVTSAKPGQFVAGADLAALRAGSAEDIALASRSLQAALDGLAALPCTTVAAINASAFGGGYELALACDWRVVADVPDIRIGFPEVSLGLLPAAGGTQRLPRLIGLPRALDLILTSRGLSARAALRAGLVDEVVHPAALERAAVDCALRSGKRRGLSLPERAVTWVPPLRALVLTQARRRVLARTNGHYPAPLRAITTIGIGLATGVAAGQEQEARAFGELASSAVARNLVALLLLGLRQRHAALAGLPPPRVVEQLAVVGAGFMGAGIAQAAAVAGMHVRVRDLDIKGVARGLATVRRLTDDASRKRAIDRREAPRVVARVSGTTDWSGFRSADLVIEAVFEDLETKRRAVAQVEAAVRDDTVIASNTSALPIAEIAAGARHPERIVGMHFFSPVHRMRLVEIVRPAAATDAAVATAVGAALALGKTPIVVRDGPGFYTTRVISAMSGEALAMLADGARIDDVDAAMTAFGWPIGPFALADEVGLEVAVHAGATVARARGVAAPDVVARLVAEGLTGKRGGAGFYRYQGKRRTPNPRVYDLLGTAPRASHEDIAERLTLAFVNEAARCLDEGILRGPDEGDLGAVLGLGFPPFLGGPFRWAAARGGSLREALAALEQRLGPRFAMAASLRERGSLFT
jgi:3-hydroxyacyl-CoA dehydrogenase/enoyl-CoA hydratase/3-hydroxybutyryl-CoA epimerase